VRIEDNRVPTHQTCKVGAECAVKLFTPEVIHTETNVAKKLSAKTVLHTTGLFIQSRIPLALNSLTEVAVDFA
jgi:hypothetical protein